jgi:molybdopterin converting factor small subunit
MSVTVELTYDMSKVVGTETFEVDGVGTVEDVIRRAREQFGAKGEEFEKLTRVTAIAVNGVLVNYRRGIKTSVSDCDIVGFVKASAGG